MKIIKHSRAKNVVLSLRRSERDTFEVQNRFKKNKRENE